MAAVANRDAKKDIDPRAAARIAVGKVSAEVSANAAATAELPSLAASRKAACTAAAARPPDCGTSPDAMQHADTMMLLKRNAEKIMSLFSRHFFFVTKKHFIQIPKEC
jgi:hypothetical protein